MRTGRFCEDTLVDAALDLGALVRGQRLRMREVEAQLVGPDRRACLLHVLAEHLPQALVQQMRAGVVRLRREADAPRYDRLHAVALREALAAEDELLVRLEAQRLDELGALAALLLEDARVG